MASNLAASPSPLNDDLQKKSGIARFPLLKASKAHPGALLRIIGVTMGSAYGGCLIQPFVLSYGTSELKIDKSVLLWAIGVVAAFELVTIPFRGGCRTRLAVEW